MEAIVSEDICIRDYTQDVEAFFRNKLTFENPEYEKKLRQGRWLGNTPQYLCLVERHGNELRIPFGMLPIVFQNKDRFSGIYHTFPVAVKQFDYGSAIKPYEYQEEAIQSALKAKQGVIVAPCGSGKTQIGLEIAARIGGRVLWLTHTSDLLKQSMDRAKNYFCLKKDDYGTITAGKVDVGKVITFATVQTMSKIDLDRVKTLFDVVIVDECHHVVGSPTQVMMFYRVISNISARYKFGLTATPKRTDGLTPCMFALLGPKICEISQDATQNTTCPVKVKVRQTMYVPDVNRILYSDGTIAYHKFIDDVISNGERNEMIVDDVVNAQGTCLVLTERVAHIETLKKKLDRLGIPTATLTATTTKKAKEERESAIYALNQKCVKVLIATYALAKEGLDVPTLDNLILATPQKNDIVITQSAGRVARKSDGKEFGTIYDYEDQFNMLKSWQRKRNSIYKKLGFEMVEV